MINFEDDAAELQAAPALGDALKRLSDMVTELTTTLQLIAETDAALKSLQVYARQLNEEGIPDLLKECGLTEVRMEDGSRVTVADEIDCGISQERRAAAHAWLREHGLGGVIKVMLGVQFDRDQQDLAAKLLVTLTKKGYPAVMEESVHHQTLKSTLKEQLRQGKPVPAELFGLRPYAKTKITYPPDVKAPAKARKPKKA